MPFSGPQFDDDFRRLAAGISDLKNVVDIGPGNGKYGKVRFRQRFQGFVDGFKHESITVGIHSMAFQQTGFLILDELPVGPSGSRPQQPHTEA